MPQLEALQGVAGARDIGVCHHRAGVAARELGEGGGKTRERLIALPLDTSDAKSFAQRASLGEEGFDVAIAIEGGL